MNTFGPLIMGQMELTSPPSDVLAAVLRYVMGTYAGYVCTHIACPATPGSLEEGS